MSSPTVTERYVTPDFKQAPLLALADLMGLKSHQSVIAASPELYAPILSGISVYRHLPPQERQQVNNAIINGIPRSGLTARLMGMVSDQSIQPYWYMWSLSDEELRNFFEFSEATVEITDQFNPLSLPGLTVTTVASGIFIMSKGGWRSLASNALNSISKSNLVTAMARRFGLNQTAVRWTKPDRGPISWCRCCSCSDHYFRAQYCGEETSRGCKARASSKRAASLPRPLTC